MLLIYAIFVTLLGYGNINYSKANPITGLAVNGTVLIQHMELIEVKGNKYYYLGSSIMGTWFEALQFCRFHEMELLSLDTLGDHDRFVTILAEIFRLAGKHWFWTSGNKRANNWVWLSSGKPLTYEMIINTEENPSQKFTYCLSFSYDPSDADVVKWYSQPCVQNKFKAHPVCETFSSINAAETIGKTALFATDPPGLVVVLFGWFMVAAVLLSVVNAVKYLL